jgi:hypothetical protein
LRLVLCNFKTSSFFISVDVTCEKETFPIIIGNDSFYDILLQSKIAKNHEEYIDIVINSIIKKKPIPFDAEDTELLKGYAVIKNDTLNILLKKDKEGFMNKYFTNNKLKSQEISFIQEKAIIYYLFNSRIYCRRDCVSGSISIVPDSLFVGINKN